MYIHVSYYMLPINVDHREVFIRKGGSICNDEFLFHSFFSNDRYNDYLSLPYATNKKQNITSSIINTALNKRKERKNIENFQNKHRAPNNKE